MKKSTFATLATLLLLSSAAYAGKDRGGGDVFVCGKNVYLADTYSLKDSPGDIQTLDQRIGTSRWNPFATRRSDFLTGEDLKGLRFLIPFKNSHEETVASQIEFVKSVNRLRYVPTVEDLPDLPDDNIQEVPAGCEKHQLAIQDLNEGLIAYNQLLYRRLSKVDQHFFPTHEVLIHERDRFDIAEGTTEEIRKLNFTYARWLAGHETPITNLLVQLPADFVAGVLFRLTSHPFKLDHSLLKGSKPRYIHGDESVFRMFGGPHRSWRVDLHDRLNRLLSERGIYYPMESIEKISPTGKNITINHLRFCLLASAPDGVFCEGFPWALQELVPLELWNALHEKVSLPN